MTRQSRWGLRRSGLLRVRQSVLMLAVLLTITGCSSGSGKAGPPALNNVYTASFSDYWADMAAFAGIDPSDGLLHDWSVYYDASGDVESSRLGFLTGKGTPNVSYFTVHQNRSGKTEFSRSRTEMKDVVWAFAIFRELDQVGLRTLETHSSVSYPGQLWWRSLYSSGRSTYSGPVPIIRDGEIISASQEPVVLTGGQGTLYVFPKDYSGPMEPYAYIFPTANNAP